jgi:hypothetical protein
MKNNYEADRKISKYIKINNTIVCKNVLKIKHGKWLKELKII